MASASTGSQTSTGASSPSMPAATQCGCCSARSKKATSGPVSTMAAVIAAEVFKVLGIGSEVWNSGVDRPPRAPHQPCKAVTPTRFGRSFEHEPQPLLDQIPKLAAAQRRLRLGSTVQIIRYFHRGLHHPHRSIKP